MTKPMGYFVNIEKEIKNKEDKFIESCALSVENLKNFLDESYKKTQKVFTDSDLLCMNLKIDGNNNRAHIQKNHFKVQEMQKWIEIKKLALELQQKDLQLAQQLNQILVKGKQSIQFKHKSLINKQNDKKMRLDKVDQFIKNCQTPNQPTLQVQQRRLYTPKSKQDPGLGIKFRPESRQLIFKIQTFDRKVAEFILFFEEQEKRYCLKNPFKNLQSSDLIAVKNFNIHNDELRLYQQLKAIVVKHIDNNEDEQFQM